MTNDANTAPNGGAGAPPPVLDATQQVVARVDKVRARDARVLRVLRKVVPFVAVLVFGGGLLAAIVLPGFIKFPCRARQGEAKGNLKAIYVAEQTFKAEKDRYSRNLQELQLVLRGETLRYAYYIHVGDDGQTFTALAAGVVPETAGDLWVIDQKNELETIANACAPD